MWDRLPVGLLLQGLALFLLNSACEASSMGAVVHIVPLSSNEGRTVRAHIMVISPNPCPSFTGVCSKDDDCLVSSTSLPFTGAKPSGWCLRQWQKTVPSNYTANIILGSNVNYFLSVKTGPKIWANGRINQPPYVALPPPLRARVNCPRHIHLAVKDPDGDRVRCRFAQANQGECLNCPQHSFIELDEEKCMLTFSGQAKAGQYSVVLMVEDFVPLAKTNTINKPLSSIPVHLFLTVEEASSSCSAEPEATDQTPPAGATISILPYEEKNITVNFISHLESVSEVAVVGPPGLFRSGLKATGPLTTMTLEWVRNPNKLPHLLPICFAANTKSLQSEPRCIWLHQREMTTLPAGTELRCENMAMTLVLPLASLKNIKLSEVQLNNPQCPVTYNQTHLTARIPLNGCGTKRVHSGSELVYTNTLRSVHAKTVINRTPTLVLPVACRFPGREAKAPHYNIEMPKEEETFGLVSYWMEFHYPGTGPFAAYTLLAHYRDTTKKGRVPLAAEPFGLAQRSHLQPRIDILDLHVMSNCTMKKVEMMVKNCVTSETEDFADPQPMVSEGCSTNNSTVEILLSTSTVRIFRINLSRMKSRSNVMYVECALSLCLAALPSESCPDSCDGNSSSSAVLHNVNSIEHKVRSSTMSLLGITAPPSTTTTVPTITTGANASVVGAPKEASTMAVGVILITIHVILQINFHH